MSPDEVSRQHHNLHYAIQTLSDFIESRKSQGKDIDKKYAIKLAELIESLKRVDKMLEKEAENQKRQREKWHKKIRALMVDAMLDKTISEEIRERIIEALHGLAEGVRTHEDS